MELTAREVSHSYGRRRSRALDDVTISIRTGEQIIMLGPNGAGKSTLMRILGGVTRPSSGSVVLTVDDSDARGTSIRRCVSWMPQTISAIPRLTVVEQVTYSAWLAGLSERQARAAAGSALERVHLSDKTNDRADALSGGQLRRLGLAEILARGSEVLLLDEPTAGLDPAQRHRFKEILASLTDQGSGKVAFHEFRTMLMGRSGLAA